MRSFQWLEEELDFIMALKSLTSQKVDIPGVTSFFCQLYGFRTSNIVEVRYKAFMRMCSGTGRELLARIKKINSSSLPPCTKTLSNHIKRAHYVARMWRRAVHINPTAEASPTDCGWKLTQNCLQPDWYPGSSVPESQLVHQTIWKMHPQMMNSQTMHGVMIVMTIMKMMRKCKGQCHEHEITII